MAAAIHTHSEIQFSAGFSFRHVCNRTTKQQAQRVFSTRPHTRSARMRAFSGVPTPMAISLAPAESNFAMESLRTEASSQLRKWARPKLTRESQTTTNQRRDTVSISSPAEAPEMPQQRNHGHPLRAQGGVSIRRHGRQGSRSDH